MATKVETIYFVNQKSVTSAEFTDIQSALSAAESWVESDYEHTPATITTYIKVSEV